MVYFFYFNINVENYVETVKTKLIYPLKVHICLAKIGLLTGY
jgi:hypothetical protein